ELTTPSGVHRQDVVSAEEMQNAVMATIQQQHIFIGCADVADYRAQEIAAEKIKKTTESDVMTLQLVKNPDIVAGVAALSAPK
ncbi:phosphopantothenoylcysteine decarboxylase, partial [Rosenbergiella nectarea]|uniref:phosphopantothenoylcysteine decarboxylase n=1 Tax=Rosenbergiella nectarea TaxID=988801 RepID=UPI001F503A97